MTSPSPQDKYNSKSQIADTDYEEKIRQSFAYYSDKWDNENLTSHYKIKRQWLLNTIHEFYQKTQQKNFNLKILDAGCGNGLYLIDIVEALENIYSVDGVGVDITEEMIDISRKRSLHLKGKYEWIQIDLENDDCKSKLGENQFDIIIMNGVVCYFKNIPKALKSLKNLLKPDGKLIIIHHNPNNLTNLVLRIQSLLESEFIWFRNPSEKEITTYAETEGYMLNKSQVLPCGGIPYLFYSLGKIFWDGYGLVFTLK
ncbi:class I SAM-dependent methyltransferase [uncultured Nostoc sp.]|uniref:class I SAM-dependent methyltransferase n=1 Tax=uncultured Nostoc sp. TaxID=340711 RepID=UPI002634EF91|nr:class I SAM-dependent methyltransferase [uncultured Nostoc sp.]